MDAYALKTMDQEAIQHARSAKRDFARDAQNGREYGKIRTQGHAQKQYAKKNPKRLKEEEKEQNVNAQMAQKTPLRVRYVKKTYARIAIVS